MFRVDIQLLALAEALKDEAIGQQSKQTSPPQAFGLDQILALSDLQHESHKPLDLPETDGRDSQEEASLKDQKLWTLKENAQVFLRSYYSFSHLNIIY